MRLAEAGTDQRAAAAYPAAEARALAAALRRELRGDVRFDAGSRALYATDASNYRQPPIGVVVPRDTDDVVAAVAIARQHGVPILARGGGTSLAGQCCNTALVLDCSKYLHRILALDPAAKRARVQPGLVLDDLRHAAEQHHLTYGPDPATHDRCTLGGMIGNNSCGVHALMAGKTSDNVEALDVLLYDGTRLQVGPTSDDELERIIRAGGRRSQLYAGLKELRDRYAALIRQRFPDIPRRVSGYNLPELLPEHGFNVARALVGSECTCVLVLEATLRLVPSPPARTLVVLGYPDVCAAADHVPDLLQFQPIGLEGFDDRLVDYMQKKGLHVDDLRLLPAGKGWLIVEFGGQTRAEADANAQKMVEAPQRGSAAPSIKRYDDPAQERLVWEVRESGLGATAHAPGMPHTWPGWEDSAVAPDQLGAYLRDLNRLFDRYGYYCSLYGHFGQGCVHVRVPFDLTSAPGIDQYRRFMDDATSLVVRYGGSLSGEHGDGQARAEYLGKMFGPELVRAFEEFKALWDPDDKLNPGKVVHPYRITDNLRLGADYRPAQPRTHFSYHEDDFSFANATLRCVGVGKCRREGGGVMCPSYMATREEEHSTRGRARLLWEMLQGSVVTDGWRSEAVKDALDLCLACKGCKGECPVGVDMATYKAEFLSHYYAGRPRPRSAYAFGLIMYWARLAARAPWAANAATHTPLVRDLAKALVGAAPERQIPRFAPRTFQAWFRARGRRNADKPPVILWPDTFNNHFHPATAKAAAEVLEAAGRRVVVPGGFLCCGRPLYDYGMLGLAKRHLERTMTTLRGAIRAGVPIVGLEPSCVSVFRDELRNLFPHDYDARRLHGQVYLLSEYLEQQVPDFQPPRLRRKALVQGHCHQQAVLKMTAELALLDKLGLDYTIPDAGCCGMAGAFGYEAGRHYAVGLAAGERVLLPAVRQASADTLIVADGFSCREQIQQGTGRRTLHLAEVLALALRHGERAPADAAGEHAATGGRGEPASSNARGEPTPASASGEPASSGERGGSEPNSAAGPPAAVPGRAEGPAAGTVAAASRAGSHNGSRGGQDR